MNRSLPDRGEEDITEFDYYGYYKDPLGTFAVDVKHRMSRALTGNVISTVEIDYNNSTIVVVLEASICNKRYSARSYPVEFKVSHPLKVLWFYIDAAIRQTVRKLANEMFLIKSREKEESDGSW